jgi:hypothetical protein
MASTYVNDLRLNEMATGDASGTWGTVTNTNLELIGEALGFGTEAITTNADTHTSTVADGATDPARAMYIKYTGTLDSACTITIAPNTLNRLHFIENGTSGSQNIIISQGSGANITIPPGDTKAVYLDGAGSGAAVVDAFASLNVVDLKVEDDLTVTDDATIGGTLNVTGETTLATHLNMGDGDIIKLGASADLTIQHDGSRSIIQDSGTGNLRIQANNLELNNADNSESYLFASADGQVELYHNNVKKFETTSDGVTVTGSLVGTTSIIPDASDGAHLGSTSAEWSDLYLADGGIIYFGNDQDVYLEHVADTGLRFPDNDKLMFGAGNDLQIYHDGSHSYVQDNGTGNIRIKGANIEMVDNDDGGSLLQAVQGAAVTLYHNNSEKFATSSAGATLTGSLTVTDGSISSGVTHTYNLHGATGTGGSVAYVTYSFVGDPNTGMFSGTADTLKFATGGSERMRIDSSGNVGILNTSPSSYGNAKELVVGSHSIDDAGITIATTTGSSGRFQFADNTSDPFVGAIEYAHGTTNAMIFYTDTDAQMRITSNGDLLVGTTDANVAGNTGSARGINLRGTANDSNVMVAVYQNTVLHLNRLNNDGSIVDLIQNGSVEGTISVSGSTVSYNSFSGSHWSRLTDNSKPTILKGTIIETIDEMCDWYQVEFTIPKTDEADAVTKKVSYSLQDGQKVGDTITYNYNDTDYQATIIKEADNKHTKCKISDTVDSKKVYGVHASWDNDDDTINDMYVTAVGTHVVRINKDTTVQGGDLLSSNGDGTAKVQDDDIIRSKTIGKVLTNIKQETYSDGSYTVPCALYCG